MRVSTLSGVDESCESVEISLRDASSSVDSMNFSHLRELNDLPRERL